jgi:hypothetical protein
MALNFSRESFHYKKLRRRRRWLRGSMLTLSALIIGIIIFIVIFYHRSGSDSDPVRSKPSKTVIYDPYKTFTTPYFTFRTDKNWQARPAESTATMFVYRSFKGQLVERNLTVYVNQLPPRLKLTYVLPVEVQKDRFAASSISDHCRSAVPASFLRHSRNPYEVSINDVHFTCWTDSPLTIIGTGVEGGSYQATMERKNGQTAQYFLYYQDVAFTPRPELFQSIVDSFQSL